ncbi:hypothetical protein [Vulgatibacter sp.]|uniref:hypothetical protein n=1 Tax=Vulgatibacter sp. TaxID=1971226 RepID=UPI00356635E2
MKRGPYGKVSRQLRGAACRILAARVGCGEKFFEDVPSPEWNVEELHPGSPEWAIRLVCSVVSRNRPNHICFDFLAHALGEHTQAASTLVSAAMHGPEALDAWIERYSVPAQEVA